MNKKIVIISGGELEEEFVLSILEKEENQYVIGVDKGMEFLYSHQILPNYIVGDFDSVKKEIGDYYQNKIRLIGGGETHLKKGETYGPYFSVFPLGEEVFGFSIKGAKYPLTNHTLIPYDSLCVSNQFQEDEVTISFLNGIVILMETKDR